MKEEILDIGRGETLTLPHRETLIGGLKIDHFFSKKDIHPYDTCEWERRNIEIMDYAKGKPSFKRDHVEVPSHWSENSVRITAAKYLFGSNPENIEYEDSLRHPFDRIANTYTIWGWKNGYFATLEDAKAYNWELKAMLLNQIWAPNSPVWFNIGHWEQWRWGRNDLRSIYANKGNKAYKAEKINGEIVVNEIDNSMTHPQMSACQPGHALINTPTGLKSMLEIVEAHEKGLSQKVLAGMETTQIVAVKRNGVKKVYRVELEDGNFIEATADHLVCAHKARRTSQLEWKKLKDLEIGEYMRVYTHSNLLCTNDNPPSKKELAEALLAGWNQADGVCAQYPNSGNPSLIMEWIALDDIEEENLRSAIKEALPNGPIHETERMVLKNGRTLRRLRMSGKHLEEFATKYELFNRKEDIRIPKCIWEASPEIAQKYLQGAFQGDGYSWTCGNNTASISIATISKDWMHDIQILLGRLGIYSRLQSKPSYREDQQDSHCINIQYLSERIAFLEKVGFLPDHEKTLKARKHLTRRGKACQTIKYSKIKNISEIGEMEVYDIQTECSYYLTNNVLVHNCFLTELEDSMESILSHGITEGRIFSSGSGVGLNMSTLRSSYEPISGRGKSSGPISFNKGWDRMAGAIKSGGRSRRAARMVIMDSDHPDVFDFLKLKNSQEQIAKVILREHNSHVELKKTAEEKLKNGSDAEKAAASFILSLPLVNSKKYAGDMDGEVYGETISDQNANHSISLRGDFWKAYWADGTYSTRWVTDPDHIQETFKASKLLEEMSKSVYDNAEPGCHNNDYINLWSPIKSKGRINTSNPCSEYLFANNTSCNLASFNAYRFLKDGGLDTHGLSIAARLAMIAADLNIEEGGFPTPEIAKGSYVYRTTGIGFGNIGGLLMSLGIPYDSDEGRYIAALLTSELTASCWKASQEMGKELGAYAEYPSTHKDLQEVLELHKACHQMLLSLPKIAEASIETEKRIKDLVSNKKLPQAEGLNGADALRALTRSFKLQSAWDPARLKATVHMTEGNIWDGVESSSQLRNSFVSLYAPMGTISAPLGIYDQGTTSAEPDYTLVKYKSLSGGGSITMFNSLALEGLKNMGYNEFQVREAALEVAGINGLIIACNGNIPTVVKQLQTKVENTDKGPVRSEFENTPRPAGEKLEELVSKLAYGQQTDLPILVTNGKGNVESIPWLPTHHKEVFDCAATTGGGTRAIAPDGHIRMLGALMPFISGAVSKTVNLPHYATTSDILECFELSHKMGVKCIALYRADSKGVSVFMADSPETQKWNANSIWTKLVESIEDNIVKIKKDASQPRRQKLPGSRNGQIIKFEIAGSLDGFIVVGIYPDGRCGEVFGRLGQGGSFAHGMFESFCKAFSVMLQWGVPLQKAIDSFKNLAFDPAGFVKVAEGHTDADIKSCKSVVDLMMRILEWLFPVENGSRLRTYKDSKLELENGVAEILHLQEDINIDNQETLLKKLGAAEMCPECHSLSVIQDGKCKRCTNCGFSNGGCGG